MMNKAFEVLKQKIAAREASAINEPYDIGLTIAEAKEVLIELEKQPESTESTKEIRVIIEEDIKIHQKWAEYFKSNPQKEAAVGTFAGNRRHHLRWIDRYKRVLNFIGRQAEIVNLAYDIHSRDPANVKHKWGVCGAQAEELLCEKIEALEGE